MIESLHSPHVARVKALIGSKGTKERRESGLFVAEGVQCAREALEHGAKPRIQTLYYTKDGASRISDLNFSEVESFEVSDDVMKAMADTVTPQGVISICEIPQLQLADLALSAPKKIIYLSQIQDPGNAGTILRTADAAGFNAVVTSPDSVDFFAPKVVRSTAGSLWHIPVITHIEIDQLLQLFPQHQAILLTAHADRSILTINNSNPTIAIFGNEARGVRARDFDVDREITEVSIPMAGRAESLNLSAAAAIVMFQLSQGFAG